MGATEFDVTATGKNAQEAFDRAVDRAHYEVGHKGYSGTIAEKSTFKMFSVPDGMSVGEFVMAVMEEDDDHDEPGVCQAVRCYQDKWGPACCIFLDDYNTYEFFGLACC